MVNPLLLVEDLSVDFIVSGKKIEAVSNVNFQIKKGETVALVGESGSGKSVTALSIMQLLPYPAARHPNGSVVFNKKEIIGSSQDMMKNIRGNEISIIFQEPMTSLNPLHTIEKQIGEVLFIHRGLTRDNAFSRTLELLELVGLVDAKRRLNAYPHELSGGERQRVMIAMALANEPKLLIADEPTTALDVTIQAQILELLLYLQNKFDMSMLFITHDLGIVRKMAQKVCVMHEGKIVESGPISDIFDNPTHGYTKHLLSSEPSGQALKPKCGAKKVIQARNIKVWFPIKEGLLKRTKDYLKAVDNISVEVHEGQTVGVVGESGSGKTTLGLALLRLTKSEGTIEFNKQKISETRTNKLRPLRREMQIVFQDPFGSLSPRMSVSQIIEEGLNIHKIANSSNERTNLIIRAMEEVGLDPDSRYRFPHEFSGGQRQRIAIARAIVLKPKFIVLDEPTSALDRSVQAQIIDLLRNLQIKHGLGYLFISHDLKVIRAISDRVIVMRHGKIIENNTSSKIFENPENSYTKSLLAAAFDIEVIKENKV